VDSTPEPDNALQSSSTASQTPGFHSGFHPETNPCLRLHPPRAHASVRPPTPLPLLGRRLSTRRRSFPHLASTKSAIAPSDWETVVTADDENQDDDTSFSVARFPCSDNRYLYPELDLAVDRRLGEASLPSNVDSLLSNDNGSYSPAVARRTTIMIPPNFSRPRLVEATAQPSVARHDSLLDASSLYSELQGDKCQDAPTLVHKSAFPRHSCIRMLTSPSGVPVVCDTLDINPCSKTSSSISDDPFKYDSQEYANVLQGNPRPDASIHRYRFDVPRDFRLLSQHHPIASHVEQHIMKPSHQTSFYHSAAIRST
jgi:hypothetical protein